MTEAEKKAIYDKAYVESLEWYKNEYKKYEDCLKIPLEKRWELIEHVKAVWALLASCGVHMYTKTEKPMSDIGDIQLKFKTEGDPSLLHEVLVSSHRSCWSVLKFEQTEEEIEAAARHSAEMEVELAECREQKKKEEEEQRRKDEEYWAKRHKAEEEAYKKNKQKMDELNAKIKAEKEELDAWYKGVVSKLDDMRKGHYCWDISDHFDEDKVRYIRNYVWTLFAFTDAQNMGMSGLGLYHQNEARAKAHEEMLDTLDLSNNKYALHITKSYDFSDDYDPKTAQYKHLDEDVVVDMLGYALAEAMKKVSIDGKQEHEALEEALIPR